MIQTLELQKKVNEPCLYVELPAQHVSRRLAAQAPHTARPAELSIVLHFSQLYILSIIAWSCASFGYSIAAGVVKLPVRLQLSSVSPLRLGMNSCNIAPF